MDIDYNEVFGLEGANEQEPAQPAAGEATEAPKEETKTTETKTETEQGENETEAAEPSVEEDAPQSKEERAKQAAARRQRERDAAIEQAKAEARAEAQRSFDEKIKSMGLENPYTGKPITNTAEYDEFKRKETEQKKGEVAEAAGMNEREFENFINNLPQVKEANRVVKAATEREQQTVLEEQIKEIGKLDPSIQTVQDLMKDQEAYKAIYQKVQRGDSIVEAYKLVHFDKLIAAAGNAAKQAALNAANSKEHLQATKTVGAGSVSVPADVKAMYRQMMPDMTDAEIQEHYNRFHKN